MATSETFHQPTMFGSLPEDSRVSLFPLPGSSEARTMTVGSGLKWLRVLNASGPVGCWLRMCLGSWVWNSIRCFLTWKPSTTPHGRLLFRLSPSMPRTEGTEFGLWPTPTLPNGGRTIPPGSEFKGGMTPTAYRDGKKFQVDLNYAVRKMWPTPTQSDGMGGPGNSGRDGGLNLRTAAQMFPTATARDWRSGKASQATMERNSRPLSEQIGGSLNPDWVEWLMGYPQGWTALPDGSQNQTSHASQAESQTG